MSKLLRTETHESPALILGLASHAPVWKLCHEINQAMKWDLQAVTEQFAPESDEPGLFTRDPNPQELLSYQDSESLAPIEIQFWEPDPVTLPADAKPFRYLLALRAPKGKNLNVDEYLPKLTELSSLISIIDLSENPAIQRILLP